MTKKRTIIIGASSEIAKALAVEVLTQLDDNLILISRTSNSDNLTNNSHVKQILVKDYSSQAIAQAVSEIRQIKQQPITQVFICHGVLHSDDIQPEKRLEDINCSSFQQVMITNALTPILWLQQLTPLIAGDKPCKIVIFSARVGSISDNRLGGWYSYRASKAALNMMIKTSAIELARRAKNIKIIAFHPGTTDTQLSKPFQNNVPENKLFTCQFVAKQLLTIIDHIEIDHTASYVDWQGQSINW
ncbi:SDR family NAD(P)-dependent oxidoreductase [Colwelliaceae bacterium 6441]